MDEAARAIAVRLKLSMPAVHSLIDDLEHAGVFVTYRETTGDLCPNCAEHYATESGFCVRCETEEALRLQREADEAEEERLREEAERARNIVKKRRQRYRELYDANPRKSRGSGEDTQEATP